MQITHEEYHKVKEYAASLERNRSDLWGVNEELRNKLARLEEGMLDLIDLQEDVRILESTIEKIANKKEADASIAASEAIEIINTRREERR